MTALAGDFGLVAARLFARLAAVLFAGSAAARNVCALLVFRFFHMAPHLPLRDTLVAKIRSRVASWEILFDDR